MSGLIFLFSSWLVNVTAPCDFELAMSHFKAQDHPQAITTFKPCLNDAGYAPPAAFFLAISYRQTGRTQQALAQFEQAQQLDPDNMNVLNEWALTYEQQGQFKPAASVYQRVLALQPGNLGAGLGAARMLHWQGHARKAVEQYRKLQTVHPGDVAVELGLGLALIADYQLREAEQIFQQLQGQNSDPTATAQGMDLLAKVRKSQLTIRHQNTNVMGNQSGHAAINYSHQLNQKSRWGLALAYHDTSSVPPQESGIRALRQSEHEFGVFVARKIRPDLNLMAQLAYKSNTAAGDLLKLHYELGHQIKSGLAAHWGQVLDWDEKRVVNTLSYMGLEIAHFEQTQMLLQLYYNQDEDFNDSHSVSVKWARQLNPATRLQLGISQSHGLEENTTLFGKLAWQYNDRTRLSLDTVNNLDSQEQAWSLGLSYEF